MKIIKQPVNYKYKSKYTLHKSSSISKIKNDKLKINPPTKRLITNRQAKFIKNDNQVTDPKTVEGINDKKELLNLILNENENEQRSNGVNINETITSQKTDRSSNFESTRGNKKVLRSRIPRRRPVVVANKLTGFQSVTRIVIKRSSTNTKVPSATIITQTDKSDFEAVQQNVEESDECKIPDSPESSPLTKKITLSLCNDDSYFDDEIDSDIDISDVNNGDPEGSNEEEYDETIDDKCVHCTCETCLNKYQQRSELLLQQLQYKHWSTSDVLKNATDSSEEEESLSDLNSTPLYKQNIYRKHTREVYNSPKRPKQHFQKKKCRYSLFHIIFDIIFWPLLFFRKAK